MNIVNKLTLRHIKENKGRTVVTTMGICVSVAMITAVFVALASFTNLFAEVELLSSGNNVAQFVITEQEQYDKLLKDERISDIGVISNDGVSYQLEKRKSNYLGTGDFISGNETYLKQMFTGEYEGKIPQNEKEIAVEQNLIDKNGLDWKVGDTVYIPIGTRELLDEDGVNVIGGSAYVEGEAFNVSEIGEYRITAILHENPATVIRGSIIRGWTFDKSLISGSSPVQVTIMLKNINHNSLEDIKDMIKSCNIEQYNIKTTYLDMFFAYDEYNETMSMIVSMAAIIIAIIIIASVVLIYNAFAMSISERVRYLGILASIGATKRQKRMSVYFESLILGAVGIPVGFAAGVAGISITLKALGSRIIETGMIAGMSDSNAEMRIVIPAYAVIGILIVSVLTIFISSFIPSLKASRVTPIDAIRQRQEIKVKAKRLRSSKLIRAIFGYEGELANKNLKRNGRKARVITVSIAMSVILFLSCNYFCDMFTRSVNVEGDVRYQVQLVVDYESREQARKALSQIEEIDAYYCVNNFMSDIDKNDGSGLANSEYYTGTYKNFTKKDAKLFVNVIDDEDFDSFCKANNIDYTQYYTDKLNAVILNNVSHKSGGEKVFNEKLIGKKFDCMYDGITVKNLAAYDSDSYICNLNPKNCISMYIPLSQYAKFETASQKSNPDIEDYTITYSMGIETEKHDEVTEELHDLMSQGKLNGENSYGYVMDYVDSMQTMNTLAFVIQVLVYGFIALISLITVFNIINTISTGIAMRKKEFAMLKSVGTTPKGFNKMIMLESAFYGLKAIVFAIPISILISFALNHTVSGVAIPFEINWILYLAVTAVVFVIVGLTMLYSVHKLRDDSIVETLKEDIS